MSAAETSEERVIFPSVVIPNEVIEDSPDAYLWYSEPYAGGYELRYGALAKKKLNELDESYVRWWMENSRSPRIRSAAKAYLDGLEEYATSHYGEFLVPHRNKRVNRQGKRIDFCRDKKSFNHLLHPRYSGLHDRYPIYFKAVQQFIDHPSHHLARRDIGEHTGLRPGDAPYIPANDNQDLGFTYRLGGVSQCAPVIMNGTSSGQSSDADEGDEDDNISANRDSGSG
ncbi:hypothetical protein CYLTODRAFT_494472 [Cylindrobasidium torrendii FP15055 ss-10]|uniref:Uncharacterized protein n=1 Tax=Cylindrobasidium torrendii FP15055 ss-10 TaxID=1314674 RepID=A0A0D7AWF2_9AGAR|nr:hypothetical protein CYLTODRAFT_494472 [Cylindrobasidium torrendii FP15055 ss-10]